MEQDPRCIGNKEIVNENSPFLKDGWIAAALLPRVLPITFTFNLCVSVSWLHYFLIWNAYCYVPGTLILPIKGWDVILFYSWVKNRRQGWPRCRLSPAAGCYFGPWLLGVTMNICDTHKRSFCFFCFKNFNDQFPSIFMGPPFPPPRST